MPAAVDLVPPVFERPDVRRACIAGVGGIFNARDEARFWAMLAGGGALDGVRLLAADRVASFSNIRANGDEPDPVMFGIPTPISPEERRVGKACGSTGRIGGEPDH